MEFSEAKALVTVDGARRKGKTAPVKASVDGLIGEVDSIETIFVVRHTGAECEMREGRDVWFEDAMATAEPECQPEPMEAEDPLFILYTSGSTAKPKGILHTTGGYMTGITWTHRHVFDLRPEEDVYWCAADVGWVTGHSYIVYGPLSNGATSVMYEGAPDYPAKDIWWEHHRAQGGDDLLHRADRDPRLHEMGGRAPRPATTSPRCGCSARSASRSTPRPGSGTTRSIGGERCPIVDTWWQTETGQIMISPLPGITATKPGSATRPLPGIEADVFDDERRARSEGGEGLLVLRRPWPGMLRTLYREDERFVETYFSTLRAGDLPGRRRRPPRRGRLPLGAGPGRRRRSTSPATGSRPPRSSRRSSPTRRSPRRR